MQVGEKGYEPFSAKGGSYMDSEIIKRYFLADTKKISENENLLRIRNWKIIKINFPIFIICMLHSKSKKEYYFSLLYDDIPISLQIVDHVNFLPLPYSEWPQGASFLQNHNVTHCPFLCAPGIREYHTHNSHSGETQWVYTSQNFRLPSVLDTVYNHLLRTDK